MNKGKGKVMQENLAERVKRIISGSANAFVTAIENAAPRVVMQEAIAEVERACDDVRADLGKLVARKHLATRELTAKNSRHEELTEQISDAVSSGRDDLAEAAIAKQMDIEAQMPILENTISELADDEKQLEGLLAALKAKKREMEQDLAEFERTQREAGAQSIEGAGATAASNGAAVAAEKATSSFNRVLEGATGLKMDRDGVDDGSLQELEELSRQNRVKERLEALKAKQKASASE